MAVGIQNYTNVSAVDSDYPNGDIKDNTGANDGTPFDRRTYADMHQFFAKMMRFTSTTPNGQPENEYRGFQYHQAMQKMYGTIGKIQKISGAPASTVVENYLNPLVVYLASAQNGHVCSLSAPDDEVCHLKTITVKNMSANSITMASHEGYNIDQAGSGITVAAGAAKTFVFDGSDGPQWFSI